MCKRRNVAGLEARHRVTNSQRLPATGSAVLDAVQQPSIHSPLLSVTPPADHAMPRRSMSRKPGLLQANIVVAQGQTEHAALAVLPGPGDLIHGVFVLGRQEDTVPSPSCLPCRTYPSSTMEKSSMPCVIAWLFITDFDIQLQSFFVPEVPVVEADEFVPEIPLFPGEQRVMKDHDALTLLDEPLDGRFRVAAGATALFLWNPLVHPVEDDRVVRVAHLLGTGSEMLDVLRVRVDARHVAEQTIEVGNVESVSSRDHCDVESLRIRVTAVLLGRGSPALGLSCVVLEHETPVATISHAKRTKLSACRMRLFLASV